MFKIWTGTVARGCSRAVERALEIFRVSHWLELEVSAPPSKFPYSVKQPSLLPPAFPPPARPVPFILLFLLLLVVLQGLQTALQCACPEDFLFFRLSFLIFAFIF